MKLVKDIFAKKKVAVCSRVKQWQSVLGEVQIGDLVTVTYDGNTDVKDVLINAPVEKIEIAKRDVLAVTEMFARAATAKKGEDPDAWFRHVIDGYPRLTTSRVTEDGLVECEVVRLV